MKDRLISLRQTWAALAAQGLASFLSCALIVVRALYARQVAYPFYFWNLFLAWIPLVAALIVYGLAARGEKRWLLSLGASVIWFLFFPNAPYIVTDLVHLHPRPPVPYWYDIITVMAFALSGLFVGYLSLYLMQEVVRARFGRWTGWAFALGMLWLSSFGIYLGRFLRWNSWDALLDPYNTLVEAARIVDPRKDLAPLAFSATFSALALVCYLIVYSFTHLHGWTRRGEEKPVAVARDLQ